MGELRVSLFGRLQAERDGRQLRIGGGKTEELFCYLLLHRERAHSRERLAEVLWDDQHSARSRKYLRQALWRLQCALRLPRRASKRRALEIDPKWVGVRTDDLWLDVAELEHAAQLAKSRKSRFDQSSLHTLQHAIELYQGDLLEEYYWDWCRSERERLQDEFIAILDALLADCESGAEYTTGIRYGELLLRHDPAHERTHQRLMLFRYWSGDRSGALRQYARCTRALKQELDVEPEREPWSSTAKSQTVCSIGHLHYASRCASRSEMTAASLAPAPSVE